MLPVILKLVLTVLMVLDLHTTSEALKGGSGREVNPVLKRVFARMDSKQRFWTLAASKLALMAFIWALDFGILSLCIMVAGYTALIINNARVYFKG